MSSTAFRPVGENGSASRFFQKWFAKSRGSTLEQQRLWQCGIYMEVRSGIQEIALDIDARMVRKLKCVMRLLGSVFGFWVTKLERRVSAQYIGLRRAAERRRG